jgi:hypothetical protein
MSRLHALLTVAVVGTIAAAVVAQMPEIRRYLKMRAM